MRTHYKRFFRARKIFSSPPRANGIDCGNESDRARKRERAGAEKIAPPLRGSFFLFGCPIFPMLAHGVFDVAPRLRRSLPRRAKRRNKSVPRGNAFEPPAARGGTKGSDGNAAPHRTSASAEPRRGGTIRRRQTHSGARGVFPAPKESVPAGYSRGNAVYNLITDSGLDHYESEVFAWPQLICGGDAKRRARERPGPREVRTQTVPESRRRARALPRISRR